MSTLTHRTAFLLGTAAILALAGCASAGTGTTESGAATPEAAAPAAKAPETVCPDGFLDAYKAAAAPDFTELAVTEVTADQFTPDFLVPLLDGACAIHVKGIFAFEGPGPVDNDFAISADPSISEGVGAALEAADYVQDPDRPGGYAKADYSAFGSVITIGGEVTTTGQAALDQYFPGGVIFNG